MDWSKNNRACTTLWTSLYSMRQLSISFTESAELKIKDFTFYNALISSELRLQQATIIVEQLDNIFRNGRGANYENEFNRGKSISAMLSVLSDETKSIVDLAAVVDNCYSFWGEVKSNSTEIK
jgi:predicted RNase H-related nuclease YkuK (DUF458 family)